MRHLQLTSTSKNIDGLVHPELLSKPLLTQALIDSGPGMEDNYLGPPCQTPSCPNKPNQFSKFCSACEAVYKFEAYLTLSPPPPPLSEGVLPPILPSQNKLPPPLVSQDPPSPSLPFIVCQAPACFSSAAVGADGRRSNFCHACFHELVESSLSQVIPPPPPPPSPPPMGASTSKNMDETPPPIPPRTYRNKPLERPPQLLCDSDSDDDWLDPPTSIGAIGGMQDDPDVCARIGCSSPVFVNDTTGEKSFYCCRKHMHLCMTNHERIKPSARQRCIPNPKPNTPIVYCQRIGCSKPAWFDHNKGKHSAACGKRHLKEMSDDPTVKKSPAVIDGSSTGPAYQEPNVCILKGCSKGGYWDAARQVRSQYCGLSHKTAGEQDPTKIKPQAPQLLDGLQPLPPGQCLIPGCSNKSLAKYDGCCSKGCKSKLKKKRIATIDRRSSRDSSASLKTVPVQWDVSKGTDGAQVPVDPKSQEYKDVEKLFKATCSQKVRKIFRIQNKFRYSLFQAYCEARNEINGPGNHVKQLFHGCNKDNVGSIIRTGVNRSFSGVHGTLCGFGSYFARDASYSANSTYATPDRSGVQRMFLVDVYTGHFTKGSNGMKTAPTRKQNTLYDSVVDNPSQPSMWVTFEDHSSYPKYLIEFK